MQQTSNLGYNFLIRQIALITHIPHTECIASCRVQNKDMQHVVKRACSVRVRVYAIVVFHGIISNPQLKVSINEQNSFYFGDFSNVQKYTSFVGLKRHFHTILLSKNVQIFYALTGI